MSLNPEQLTNLSAQDKRELLKRLLEQKKTNQPKTYPLSFAQERLWFLEQFEPGSAVYNIPRVVRLRGQLDVGALQQAVDAMVVRHEMLRTTFTMVEGVPTQVVAAEGSIVIQQVNLGGADGEDSAVFLPYLLAESTKPFNLTTGTLLRLQLLHFSSTNHILLLTMHHIISDGWSMSVLTRELAQLYAKHQLRPLGLQYGRFAQQQRHHLQGPTLETLIGYWRTALTGAPPLLQLPTDRPRPVLQTFDGATFNVVLPTALTHSLKTFCQQQGVTLFAVQLAAFKTLLYRYTNQPDLCVGTPAANRTRREVEDIIGIFVNTLVLRTILSPEWTFNDVLQRVRQVVLGALAHQEMPFEQLVEVLQPERSLSHHPLFQVMFILQNAPESDIHLPGLTMTPLEVDNGTAKFDLTVSVRETADSLTASFEYNTHLFERETIQRMAGHYQVLLQAALAQPAQPILQLPLLTPQEQHQLLVEWNKTTAVFPPVCVHQLFEAQVEKTPDKKAAVFGTQSLTYRQLDDRANQVAHSLQAQGIGVESLVGVQMERSLDMLVAVLGILKAGAAYVPLDPAFPADRLAFMAQDADLRLILINSPSLHRKERKERKEEKEGLRLILDELVTPNIQYPISNIFPLVSQENLAYVIYTSGSTGKPKGVQVTHRGVVNFLHSMSQQPGLTADDVLFAITTLSFDIAGLELFLPLCVGAQVVIASRQQQTDGKQLLAALAESRATVMQATPATWQLLLEAGWQEPRLHKILCGGEALSRSLADQLLEQADEVWNLYGPTETTIWSTCHRVEKERGEETAVSIGRPIANTQIYILDGQLQPVPIGVAGDLYIGGAGLARGYLNRPELTAERFVSVLSTQYSVLSTQYSVFSELGTDHWSLGTVYRTGDVARYRPNGEIEFLGRSDFQVKVRGFRIELGEIEAALRKNTAVSDAVVVVRQDVPDDKQLVAYLLKQTEPVPTPSELRLFLQKSLPDYMIPAVFVWLEAYPLTPNGKVNRLALPAVQTAELPTRFVPPRDLVELHLAQIWGILLNRQPVGVHDNFFELGGHSLLAMRLMAQVEKKFGRSLPLTALFQNQTVEQLASHLKNLQLELSPPSSLLAPRSSPFVPLISLTPSTSSAPPFFLVHPVGGTVFCYVELAKLLEGKRPIFGIAANEQDPIADIPTLAARYLAAIRQQQPIGPYYLGGWSLGGLIAFEMARQLGEQQVAFLALIDANPISNLHSPLSNLSLLTRFLTELHGGPLADETAVLQHLHMLTEDKQLEYIAEQARGMGLLPPDAGVERIRPLITLFRTNLQALHTYQPGFYGGNLHFFPAHTTPEDSWHSFVVQPVTVHASPGTHYTLLTKPHVQKLAEFLRLYL